MILMEEVKNNNEFVSIFDEPKIMDATGKELTKKEIIEFMKMRKEILEKQRQFIENNKDDEMFRDIPRQR